MKDILLEIFKSSIKDATRRVKHVQLMITINVKLATHLMINLKVFSVVLVKKKTINFYYIIQDVFRNVLQDMIIKLIIYVRSLNV